MSIFIASPEGFREQNVGREAAHLVRELIQNVLDEAATKLIITVRWSDVKGAVIVVEDDVAGGFRDEKLIFTIWQSDKQDVPTKRGRMGRGLKEMVSVSDRTVVETQGRGVVTFRRDRETHEWTRSQSTKPCERIGTRVECWVSAWKRKDVTSIIKFVKAIRPPAGLTMTINDEAVTRQPFVEKHTLYLTAPIFVLENGERKERERTFSTPVELFREDTSRIYEMGIPVDTLDYPFSVDIGQRVPLREKRDAIPDAWRCQLFAELINKRMPIMADSELRDNHVLIAAQRAYLLEPEVQKRIVNHWTQGKPYASTPKGFSVATGQHIECVSLRKLPESIRGLVTSHGEKIETVLERRRDEFCPVVAPTALTEEQQRFIRIWEWVCKGIGRPSTVRIASGTPDCTASYARETSTLTVYVKNISVNLIRKPLSAEALALLIHELAHWRAQEDEHGLNFHADGEHVGGEIAAFLYNNAGKGEV